MHTIGPRGRSLDPTMPGSSSQAMDVETAEALDRLGERVDRLEVSLRGEMAAMRDELRGEFRTGLAETSRRMKVLYESLRDDIRPLAAGVAHLAAKIDRLHG